MPGRSRSRAQSARTAAGRRRRRLGPALVLIGIALLALVVLALVPWGGEVRKDERIVLFATAAHLSGDGRAWVVPIRGWVFEPEQDAASRRAMIALVRRALELDESSAASEVLKKRLGWFLVDNQRGKRVVVHVAGQRTTLGPSDELGHFSGSVQVPIDAAKTHARDGKLRIQATSAAHPAGRFGASVRLVGPSGLSVISDIDDTVKVSEVRDRKALLRNTLLRSFRPAPGMPELYRRWARTGVTFHYVSSSPWQLYEPLAGFMREAGLPATTFELKAFRLKDSSVLDLWADPIRTKPPVIEAILGAYPGRRFCLVGDSGERDPEIYGLIARRHPQRIACIYIRNVTDEPPTGARFQEAFRGVEEKRWRVFTDPSELPPPS